MQRILEWRKRLVIGAAAFGTLAVLGSLGWLVYDNTHYIATDNASIAGELVQIASPDAGRIAALPRGVGDTITPCEALATVDIPLSTVIPGGGSRNTFLDARDRLAPVTSPVEGVVVSRSVHLGDTVAAGQVLFTIVDTRNLWVVANIEETRIREVRPGQAVDVTIDSLRQTVPGVVETIIPVSTSTFSLIPAQNAGGNFTKVVQLVPVRISLLSQHPLALIIGASASVRIRL
ncbi:MAG: HlyD family efflux transporter periplasmic adaptor subunit [Chloroflexota bacterium]